MGVGLAPPPRCRVAGWSLRRRFRIVMNVPPAALQEHLTAFDRCAARLLPSEPERPVGGGAARSGPFGRTLNHCNARRLPRVRVELRTETVELGEAIRTSAAGADQSVSAWLADAARDRLRLQALGEAVNAWEQEFGPLTDTEIAQADCLLERAAKLRPRRGAA